MSNQINYKQKYMELKSKFMSSVDEAFRLGFEQGAQQEQQNQMAQQQAQQQEIEQAQAAGMNQPGQPGETQPGEQPPASENPQGSELDQHIAKLESMIAKNEPSGKDLAEAIAGLKGWKEKITFAAEMKKSSQAIPAIAKALHKPAFKVGVQASHNMNSNAKAAVNMQEKVVTDIMKAWADEEQSAAKKISAVLNVEGLAKKE